MRLDLQAIVANVAFEADMAAKYFVKMFEHRAWTLMKKKDGACFSSIEELCSAARPWGLGKPWPEIRPYIEAALERDGVDPHRALQLETVPEPQTPPPGPGRGKRSDAHTEHKTRGDDCPQFSERTAKALRAINRAPEPVREAYREGRISQTLAAKLGPKNPTPEQAAKITEVAGEIRKTKDRKAVDGIVREHLGVSRDAIREVVRRVERMQAPERIELRRQLEPLFLDAEEQVRRTG